MNHNYIHESEWNRWRTPNIFFWWWPRGTNQFESNHDSNTKLRLKATTETGIESATCTKLDYLQTLWLTLGAPQIDVRTIRTPTNRIQFKTMANLWRQRHHHKLLAAATSCLMLTVFEMIFNWINLDKLLINYLKLFQWTTIA